MANPNPESKLQEKLNMAIDEVMATHEAMYLHKKAQKDLLEDLSQTQQALHLALDTARMGSWEWDLTTNQITWSKGMEPLHGLKPGEFTSVYGGCFEGFRQLVHPHDLVLLENAINQALAYKTFYSVEFRVIWPDGSVHWMSGQGSALYDEAGKPLRMVGIGMDITERKEHEEQLRRSERLKQEIFEGSADALFLINARTYCIEDYNQQAVNLFGYKDKQELIGTQAQSLHKQTFTQGQIRKILREIYTNKHWTSEVEYISKTGRVFWGNAAITLINVDGAFYFLVRIRDITERKKAEEEITRSQQELLLEKQRTEEALAIIAKDNLRKTKELEEARALQLSMLPQSPPALKDLDIAMFMKTCAEVGGDYYDYKVDEEGNLTVILGDATGHGLKAGIVVATVKSYFQTLANQCTVSELLARISEGIQNLQIRGMYMGVTVIKIKDCHLTIASSGMPPLYLYNKVENTIEQITLKGLFLGSSIPFPYQYTYIPLKPGDTLLALTDGLPELFNPDREMLGYERIQACFKAAASLPSEQIIKCLNHTCDAWAAGHENEDDISVIVIKAKG